MSDAFLGATVECQASFRLFLESKNQEALDLRDALLVDHEKRNWDYIHDLSDRLALAVEGVISQNREAGAQDEFVEFATITRTLADGYFEYSDVNQLVTRYIYLTQPLYKKFRKVGDQDSEDGAHATVISWLSKHGSGILIGFGSALFAVLVGFYIDMTHDEIAELRKADTAISNVLLKREVISDLINRKVPEILAKEHVKSQLVAQLQASTNAHASPLDKRLDSVHARVDQVEADLQAILSLEALRITPPLKIVGRHLGVVQYAGKIGYKQFSKKIISDYEADKTYIPLALSFPKSTPSNQQRRLTLGLMGGVVHLAHSGGSEGYRPARVVQVVFKETGNSLVATMPIQCFRNIVQEDPQIVGTFRADICFINDHAVCEIVTSIYNGIPASSPTQ